MNRHCKLFLAFMAGILSMCPNYVAAQGQAKPKQQAPAVQEQEETPYTEEEYDAYEKATKETELDKRGPLLVAFIEKYPKSTLMSYIVTSYETMMYEYSKAQKWDKLESAAEQWLKYHPESLQTVDYLVSASSMLGHDQKCIDYALKIYAQKPSYKAACLLQSEYKKTGNDAKYTEWTEKVLNYPESEGDFATRYEFANKYFKEMKLAKAAEWAHATLKSLDVAKKPDDVADAVWRKNITTARRDSNYMIGYSHYETKNYPESIKSMQAALKVERFDDAYYFIAMAQWKMERVEEAILSFAKAELLKGDKSSQAKEQLEKLYKSLHNNTTIGIEKVYKKAESELSERSAAN